jgi:hypothetical protein
VFNKRLKLVFYELSRSAITGTMPCQLCLREWTLDNPIKKQRDKYPTLRRRTKNSNRCTSCCCVIEDAASKKTTKTAKAKCRKTSVAEIGRCDQARDDHIALVEQYEAEVERGMRGQGVNTTLTARALPEGDSVSAGDIQATDYTKRLGVFWPRAIFEEHMGEKYPSDDETSIEDDGERVKGVKLNSSKGMPDGCTALGVRWTRDVGRTRVLHQADKGLPCVTSMEVEGAAINHLRHKSGASNGCSRSQDKGLSLADRNEFDGDDILRHIWGGQCAPAAPASGCVEGDDDAQRPPALASIAERKPRERKRASSSSVACTADQIAPIKRKKSASNVAVNSQRCLLVKGIQTLASTTKLIDKFETHTGVSGVGADEIDDARAKLNASLTEEAAEAYLEVDDVVEDGLHAGLHLLKGLRHAEDALSRAEAVHSKLSKLSNQAEAALFIKDVHRLEEVARVEVQSYFKYALRALLASAVDAGSEDEMISILSLPLATVDNESFPPPGVSSCCSVRHYFSDDFAPVQVDLLRGALRRALCKSSGLAVLRDFFRKVALEDAGWPVKILTQIQSLKRCALPDINVQVADGHLALFKACGSDFASTIRALPGGMRLLQESACLIAQRRREVMLRDEAATIHAPEPPSASTVVGEDGRVELPDKAAWLAFAIDLSAVIAKAGTVACADEHLDTAMSACQVLRKAAKDAFAEKIYAIGRCLASGTTPKEYNLQQLLAWLPTMDSTGANCLRDLLPAATEAIAEDVDAMRSLITCLEAALPALVGGGDSANAASCWLDSAASCTVLACRLSDAIDSIVAHCGIICTGGVSKLFACSESAFRRWSEANLSTRLDFAAALVRDDFRLSSVSTEWPPSFTDQDHKSTCVRLCRSVLGSVDKHPWDEKLEALCVTVLLHELLRAVALNEAAHLSNAAQWTRRTEESCFSC